MEDIGWDALNRRFVDVERRMIRSAFKLYPWEWMLADAVRRQAVRQQATHLDRAAVEDAAVQQGAAGRAVGAVSRAIPNLLPAYLDGPRDLTSYIAKPLLGREGASMRIVTPAGEQETPGSYGEEGYVFQGFDALPDFDGQRPVLGAWVIADEAAGLGIRETTGLITDDTSSFVPHRIEHS